MKASESLQNDQSAATENALRRAVDTTPAFIHTARPDGYLDYFNQGWLDFLGKTLEGESALSPRLRKFAKNSRGFVTLSTTQISSSSSSSLVDPLTDNPLVFGVLLLCQRKAIPTL